MASATDTTAGVINNVTTWYKQPFATSMSAGGWFLFFGLIIAVSAGWAIILKDLRGEV